MGGTEIFCTWDALLCPTAMLTAFPHCATAVDALSLSFATVQAFPPEDCTLLLALGRLCAQALERARLYQLEQQARVELERRVQERTVEVRPTSELPLNLLFPEHWDWRIPFARTLVEYTVQTYGLNTLPSLIAGCSRYDSWQTLIPAVYGVSAEQFERAWQAYLAAHYGVAPTPFRR